MNAMPLAFEEFQGKGFPLDLSSSSSTSSSESGLSKLLLSCQRNQKEQRKDCYVGCEPTSVLDRRRSPSPPTSSSTTTLSSSLNADAVAATLSDDKPSLSAEDLLVEKHQKCGLGIMDDWETVLSEASPGQEHSILRLIMADVDDPSLALNKLLHSGADVDDFNAGFGVVEDNDHHQQHHHQHLATYGGFETLDHHSSPSSASVFGSNNNNNNNNLLPVSFSPAMSHQQQEVIENFNSQMLINQNQAQFAQPNNNNNTAFVMPLTHSYLQNHHQAQLISPPPPKRLNTGVPGVGPNFHPQKPHYLYAQHQHQHQHQQLLSQHHVAAPPKPKPGGGGAGSGAAGDDLLAMADQLSKAAELIEAGSNPILAQGILARLNHQLTPLGNNSNSNSNISSSPLQRACFYFKEALQSLINSNNNSNSNAPPFSPFNLIFKIGAHKSFSEISPALQFSNFTSNQAILDATKGFPRIHLIDFDIGFGGQWASLMQELALLNHTTTATAPISLKITAFASSTAHDEFELGFTHDNLRHFAADLSLPFDLDILPLEALPSWAAAASAGGSGEAVAVNLPLSAFSGHPTSLPLAFRIAKQLSPKVMVALERACDRRPDVPFPLQVAHGLGAHAALLESLDAVNAGPDVVQKIERSLLQPGIEKMVLHGSRRGGGGGHPPWRGLAAGAGFSPASFSNFAESQAECLVQRTPARGFHVERRQSSLVLCWQRKELVSLSVWRC